MYTASQKFLHNNRGKSKKKERTATVERLLLAVTKELLFSTAFNVNFTATSEFESLQNATLAPASTSKFSAVKLARRQLGGQPSPDEIKKIMSELQQGEDKLLKSFQKLKDKRNLTSQELKALYTYTDHQYMLMNPAGAQNPDWFLIQMQKHKKDISPEKFQEAYEINKMIHDVAASGVGKIPEWTHVGTIYRGETVPVEDATALGRAAPGFGRNFPHLVSTSTGIDTPLKECKKNKSDGRPYQIIYHIIASSGGRDVASFAKSQNEAEIIFLPGTWFKLVKVLQHDPAAQIMYVKVTADGGSSG